MANWKINTDIQTLDLNSSGDEFTFLYEDPDEVLVYVNSPHPSVLSRSDIIELVGFLSQFIDGEI